MYNATYINICTVSVCECVTRIIGIVIFDGTL